MCSVVLYWGVLWRTCRGIAYELEGLLGVYLFDPSIYLINRLPSRIVFNDVAAVVGIALTVSFLATLYPAWRAGKILPAEALRYDH